MLNNCRINGNALSINNDSNVANQQHSPVTNVSNGGTNNSSNFGSINDSSSSNRNGGSPNQVNTLASELAKCQLRKVNLSRSDSDRESECNNNIANAKTTRAASLAHVPNNLMNDLAKTLALRRNNNINGNGNGTSNSNSNGTNAINCAGDKATNETWLADLIRKEISKEMTKAKAEIIEAIRSEMKK